MTPQVTTKINSPPLYSLIQLLHFANAQTASEHMLLIFNLFKAVLVTSNLIKTSKYEISDISPMQSGTSSAHTHVYPSGLVGLSRHIEDELQLALSHGFSTAA